MRNYLERLNRMPEAWDSGSVDVSGPTSSTDNAVVRWDGTSARTLQNSVVTIGDTGAVAGVTTLAASGTVTLTATAAAPTKFLDVTGSTTAYNYMRIANTTASIIFGAENSTGGALAASSAAYSCVFGPESNTAMHFITNNLIRQTTFANGNVAIGTTTDNSAKLQVSGNLSCTQAFIIGDSGGGLASTVSFTNVTTESISTGVVSFFTSGTTARSNTGWHKVYIGTAVRYYPYLTTITG